MKKFLALMLALLMVLALAACGSKADTSAAEEPATETAAEEEAAPAEEETAEEEAAPAEEEAAEDGDVTWADYQAYLIEKASANSPDPDAFKAEVEALTGWDDIDETAAPWNLMFTTIGLSTWEAFQAGERNEPLVSGGPDATGEIGASEEPAAEAVAVDGASQEPAGDASGEPSGQGDASADYEITVNGVTGTAHYEDVDNGDQTTKSFVITFDGKEIPGAIDKGVWTADSGDEVDQAVVAAVQAAFEGGNASGEPSA